MKALLEEMILAILIKKTYSLEERFDDKILKFFSDLFTKCRPDKFKDGSSLEAGKVILLAYAKDGKVRFPHRILCFKFSNGYVWLASLKKIASDEVWKEANIQADITIAQYPNSKRAA